MSDPQQLDRELIEYLEKEPNLRREDRIAFLRAIVNKHLEFNKLEHLINSRDMHDIISTSKNNYTHFHLPLHITKKQVEGTDLPHVAVIESLLSYLNKMNLLKKLVKFDYTR